EVGSVSRRVPRLGPRKLQQARRFLDAAGRHSPPARMSTRLHMASGARRFAGLAGLSGTLVLAALFGIVPCASAHFGFDDGHTWAGVGIVIFGGAIAVIGLLAYLAFGGKEKEPEEEPEQE